MVEDHSYEESMFAKISEVLRTSVGENAIVPDLLKSAQRLAGHAPVVGLFGKTGAGKSALGNGLFGCDVFQVSDIEAGTSEAKPITQTVFGVKMTVIDFPGIAESLQKDEEYRQVYSNWAGKIDFVLWLVKSDERALEPDVNFLNNVVKPAGIEADKIIYVLSQAEKIAPLWEWDREAGLPGPNQANTLAQKMVYVAEVFGTTLQNVVAVSTDQGYGLPSLASRVLEVCPSRAILSVARAMRDEMKTEQATEVVKKRLIDYFKDFVSRNEKEIMTLVTTVLGIAFGRRRL